MIVADPGYSSLPNVNAEEASQRPCRDPDRARDHDASVVTTIFRSLSAHDTCFCNHERQ